MKTLPSILLIALVGLWCMPLVAPAKGVAVRVSNEPSKTAVLARSPVKGGLLVHLGPSGGGLLLEFAKNL